MGMYVVCSRLATAWISAVFGVLVLRTALSCLLRGANGGKGWRGVAAGREVGEWPCGWQCILSAGIIYMLWC